MNLTDEQRAALDRHWKELFEDVVPTETEMVAYGYLYGYFKRGYAAIHREIEELRQFIAEIGYVECGDDLIARRNDADGSFVLFEEDNPAYSVTGSDAFEVWRKWKQEVSYERRMGQAKTDRGIGRRG